MKKILYLLPVLLLSWACSGNKTNTSTPAEETDVAAECAADSAFHTYRMYCPSDSATDHTHQFAIENYYPTNLLDHDGWYCETCQYCGQEFMFNNDYECTEHEGTVCAFRAPETGQFTDFCVCFVDDRGTYQYLSVEKQSLRYVPQPEEDTDSI